LQSRYQKPIEKHYVKTTNQHAVLSQKLVFSNFVKFDDFCSFQETDIKKTMRNK